MTSLTQDIQDKLKRLNVFEKIIVLNILIYLIGFILQHIVKIASPLHWFSLPREFMEVIMMPWTILTYGFVHYDFIHILFNMLVLYMIAKMLLNLFSTKMCLNIYFLGIICGGLAFVLVYNLLPSSFLKPAGVLVGASAGVRALLIFLCAYFPSKDIRIITFNIQLMYIGLVLVAIDILGLFSDNQGGNVAHLGGALLGYIYAVQLKKGTDIGKGFEKLMDKVTSWFNTSGNSPLKTVHKKKTTSKFAGHTKTEFNEFNKQKQIDLILEKISKSGYESLTKAEKEFLFKAGKD
ncbi:rhomboid family intramembrane serine protease [Ichthyenterobacterium sp. W332]|uniref:Rhomboid family intramembrane serine protease n=1 Tax=Microcosmobacter mediterraneus TaxID=3075607 RepID=A0ABU2YGN7_9FLAO|nr:rhomboid family intramembrane serine protease [Ichthyenterobacterium sp. W332]MDT0557202.1 rhomboid family intramembrane serine protease [Ichthyenterobacterium sp. W332]